MLFVSAPIVFNRKYFPFKFKSVNISHIVILECLKGKHLELVRPKEALTKLFDRFFNNLKSISLMIKALMILHRAL